jgi:hypothetical protein
MSSRTIDHSGRDVPRNEHFSQVNGISASVEFWKEVDRRGEETGLGRSGVIVETLVKLWNIPGAATRSVGRPRKKTVKRAKK